MKRLIGLVLLITSLSLAAAQPVEVVEETETYRLVRHAGGETQVPLNPERVVTIHSSHLDNAVALGVVPVGAGVLEGGTLTYSHPEYLHEALSEVTPIGNWSTPSFEAILALAPDLILANAFHEEIYEQLSRIAPTIIAEATGVAGLRETAKVLGRTEQAEAVIADYERTVKEAQEALAEVIQNGERVAFLRVSARDSIRVYGVPEDRVDGTGYLLHTVLGLTPAPLVPNEWLTQISLEVLPELGADHLFVMADDEAVLDEIAVTPLWNTIPAVQQGQVYPVSYGMWQGAGRVQGMKYFVAHVTKSLTDSGD
jgi:iron complex transport system substrate-binding protein